MTSGRAIHLAARAELEARWFVDWLAAAPYAWLHPRFVEAVRKRSQWPQPEQLDELAAVVPHRTAVALPRFVTQHRGALEAAGGYEPHVALHRAVPTRPRSWHDFFNMVVWAHFPRLRWELNALHVDRQLGPVDPRNGRAPAQNLAAQLDESGIIVASADDELLEDLRQLRFKRALWERRDAWRDQARFWIIGHGSLESLLTPHPGLASKGILLRLPRPAADYDESELRGWVDEQAAAVIAALRSDPRRLDPIPLLGLPGFTPDARAELYDDARYFRFERRAR